MAKLSVLEGNGGRNRRATPKAFISLQGRGDDIVYGDVRALMGRSLWKKVKGAAKSVAKVSVAPVTMTYTATKSAAKATGTFIKHPSMKNLKNVVLKPGTRAVNETKTDVREAGHAAMETGRATKIAADVGYRVVKRLIRKLAAKVLLKGDHYDMLGEDGVAKYPKNAAKGVLIPLATAAVVANTTTAPFSPAVPVIVNSVIDELYSAIAKRIKKGLSPAQAKQEVESALTTDDDAAADKALDVGGNLPLILGGVGLLVAVALVLKKRRG